MKLVNRPRLMRGRLFVLLLALTSVAYAEPYRPADDAQVLERLPAGANGKTLRALRSRVQNPEAAALLARSYIERARRESDPRDLGYAQGLLAPWWQDARPPLSVLLLRATLRQSRHEFNGALDDLDLFLKQRPDDAQAWLTRATVLRVVGRFGEAAESCTRLKGLAAPFVSELCRLSVAGLSGHLAESYAQARRLREIAAPQSADVRAWLQAELGDMAERLGKQEEAEAHYREGLAQAPGDHGLRAAYADLLLELGRAREVPELVKDLDRVDALRLRHALALKALDDPGFAALDAQIEAGYQAAHLRNEDLHLREEARYALQAHADAVRGLKLAQANWQVQHEPWDARLLLLAAQAAHQPQAAQPVREWLQASGMEDARLPAYLKGGVP